jgi:hypothetical protein
MVTLQSMRVEGVASAPRAGTVVATARAAVDLKNVRRDHEGAVCRPFRD